MNYYWLAIIPAVAFGGLNTLYDAWPGSSSSLASVERECNRMVAGSGIDRSQGKQLCSCMVEKASDWRDANPGEEYTRDAHTTIAATCVNRVDRAQITSSAKSSSRPLPSYDPAVAERLRQAGVASPGAKAPPPSDWGGGDGFAADGAWSGE